MGPRHEWLGRGRSRLALLGLLLCVGGIASLSRGPRWLGSWKLAVDEASGSIFLVGPVAAGIACGVYVRLRRSHVEELLHQAARPWRGWISPALGVWGLAGAAVVGLGLVMTSAASLAGSSAFPQVAWVAVPTVLALGAEVAVGALVGARVPHYWTVPWVGVGTFLLVLLTRVSVIPIVFDTGPASGELIGETFHPSWFAFQAITASGIVVAAMAGTHPQLFRASSLLWRVISATAAAAALAVLLLAPRPLSRYELAPEAADVCRESRPVVCMTRDGHRPLDDLASTMESVARPLVDAGIPLPDRFVPVESRSATDRDVGMLLFADDEELAAEVDDTVAARSLAMPTRCPAYFGDRPPPQAYFSVSGFLVRWLLVRAGDENAPTDGSLASWWRLPVRQQHPWVRATYAALTSCQLEALSLPDPAGALDR